MTRQKVIGALEVLALILGLIVTINTLFAIFSDDETPLGRLASEVVSIVEGTHTERMDEMIAEFPLLLSVKAGNVFDRACSAEDVYAVGSNRARRPAFILEHGGDENVVLIFAKTEQDAGMISDNVLRGLHQCFDPVRNGDGSKTTVGISGSIRQASFPRLCGRI